MTINEMAKAVADGINARGIEAEVTEVNKNGVIKVGVILGTGNVRPTMYVNEEINVDDMIDTFIKQFNELPTRNFDDIINDFTNFDKIKDKIIPVVVMKTDDTCVSRKFLDLNVIYKVTFGNDEYVTVKKDHLNTWNITEEELYDIALSNVKRTFNVTPLSEVLGIPSFDNKLMSVVTNENKVFGASAILFKDIFMNVYNIWFYF